MELVGIKNPTPLLVEFPWVRYLPEDDAQLFLNELDAVLDNVPDPDATEILIHAWQCTAEAHQAGWGKTDYVWLSEEIPVERPVAEGG